MNRLSVPSSSFYTITHSLVELGALSILYDNYAWFLRTKTHACIVDPGEATPILQWLSEHQLELTDILITHHHLDHIGGVAALLKAFPLANIWASERSHLDFPAYRLKPNDSVELHAAIGLNVRVLDLSGHTFDQIGYVWEDASSNQAPFVFCGDALFSAGCGRIFEDGSLEDVYLSLQRLKSLHPSTRICCTHEYTLTNLKFARSIDPNNLAFQEAYEETQALLSQYCATLPSTLEKEFRINLFLKAPDFLHFKELRNLRDQFKSSF